MEIRVMCCLVMCNCVHCCHGKSVSPEAIVVWKLQLRHFLINPGPHLFSFVILYKTSICLIHDCLTLQDLLAS